MPHVVLVGDRTSPPATLRAAARARLEELAEREPDLIAGHHLDDLRQGNTLSAVAFGPRVYLVVDHLGTPGAAAPLIPLPADALAWDIPPA